MSDFYNSRLKLSDVVGKQVVEVVGYISNEFGDHTFIISAVKFKDGTFETCGGEHDAPYVECDVPERFVEKEEEEES